MKRLIRNNIFTDPEGWTQKSVGSAWRYRVAQVMTIVLGVGLFFMFYITRRPHGPWVAVALMVFFAAIEMPLLYLRALRYFYLKNEEYNQSKAEGDEQICTATHAFNMLNFVQYSVIIVLPIIVLVSIGVIVANPRNTPSAAPIQREGSIDYARLWRYQLLDCSSISDIQKAFNCRILNIDANTFYMDTNTLNTGKYSATVYDFNNGDWIAIITAMYSPDEPPGNTVATIDSDRRIRTFFGHFYPPFDNVASINDVYALITERDWKELNLE